MRMLKQDIDPVCDYQYVLISNKQKGLARVISEIWPRAEHRNCVQHIYCNFKKVNKGQNLRDALWFIARCTNKEQFKRGMDRLQSMDEQAHRWILANAGDPKHWCRAYFPCNVYSDMLCNNPRLQVKGKGERELGKMWKHLVKMKRLIMLILLMSSKKM